MVETVSFRNKAVKIAGHLHLPENFSEDKKYPALVGIHPAGGVKEQTIGQYAKRLAAHGFVTVVYDSSYQGASGGEPRLLEDPTTRVEDARCAADFLTTLPFVDSERMGVFGICAAWWLRNQRGPDRTSLQGSGYRQRSSHGRRLQGLSGAPVPGGRADRNTGNGRPAAHGGSAGAEPLYAPFVPETLEEINENTPDLLREGYDYYRTPRG